MSLPYALMPVCRQQHRHPTTDLPLAGGSLEYYLVGSTTPATVYATATGTALGTSVTLDACGYAPAIYLAPGGYKVILKDTEGVVIWTQDGVEDIASTFLTALGENLVEGSQDEASGYEVLSTDAFVSMASTGGANPCVVYLPAASDHPGPLCIKNVGTIPLAITVHAGDTIDLLDEVFAIPAAVTPLFPSIWIASDGISNWWILSAYGL